MAPTSAPHSGVPISGEASEFIEPGFSVTRQAASFRSQSGALRRPQEGQQRLGRSTSAGTASKGEMVPRDSGARGDRERKQEPGAAEGPSQHEDPLQKGHVEANQQRGVRWYSLEPRGNNTITTGLTMQNTSDT